MSSKIIVHIVHREKFTSGYINYMEVMFPQYRHRFFVHSVGFPLNLISNENVTYVKSFNCLVCGENYRLLKASDKIIVTGVFLYREFLPFLRKSIIEKTFLHFWGGDFYFARNKGLKTFLKKRIVGYLLNHCRASVSLIEGDVEELKHLFPNRAAHFVAAMPAYPVNEFNYDSIMANCNEPDVVRVLVGNSATPENHHVEVFEFLKKFCGESIEVFCPLSYGDSVYRSQVLKFGKAILGDKFVPMLDFLNKDDYISFLATCSVGIFNNDRQQAMGNITNLLKLGKKVYMRDTTSMWERYKSNGFILYPISQISNCTYQQFIEIKEKDRLHNLDCSKAFMENNKKKTIENWQRIFDA